MLNSWLKNKKKVSLDKAGMEILNIMPVQKDYKECRPISEK
jgi:hypothetical protein